MYLDSWVQTGRPSGTFVLMTTCYSQVHPFYSSLKSPFPYIFSSNQYISEWTRFPSYVMFIFFVFMEDRYKSDFTKKKKNRLLFKFNTHANTNSFFLSRKNLHWFLHYIFLPLDVSSDSNKFIFIHHMYWWMKFYLLWLRTCLKKV